MEALASAPASASGVANLVIATLSKIHKVTHDWPNAPKEIGHIRGEVAGFLDLLDSIRQSHGAIDDVNLRTNAGLQLDQNVASTIRCLRGIQEIMDSVLDVVDTAMPSASSIEASRKRGWLAQRVNAYTTLRSLQESRAAVLSQLVKSNTDSEAHSTSSVSIDVYSSPLKETIGESYRKGGTKYLLSHIEDPLGALFPVQIGQVDHDSVVLEESNHKTLQLDEQKISTPSMEKVARSSSEKVASAQNEKYLRDEMFPAFKSLQQNQTQDALKCEQQTEIVEVPYSTRNRRQSDGNNQIQTSQVVARDKYNEPTFRNLEQAFSSITSYVPIRPRSDIETLRLAGQPHIGERLCSPSCRCQCHASRKVSRLNLVSFRDSIGTFSLAFTSEAPGVGNTTCSLKTCRARNSRWLKVMYTFPSWLFRAAIAATFSDSGIGSPEFLLRVHRVIPAGGFMYFNSIIGHVARGEIENVKGLLRRKEAAVTDQLSDWDGGTTALHLALGNYDIPMVKLLLHEGADMFMERQGRPGQAPFVVAIQNVYASPDTPAPEREALESLLPMDALLEMAEFSPLHKIVLGIRHLDLPEFLRLNTCPLESVDTTGLTPLHYAAIRGDARAARALLDAGAELEFASRERRETALLLACRHASSLEVVEMLVAAGADVNTSNAVGRTPLIMVTFKKGLRRTNRMADPVRIMAVLVRAGADVHAQDKYHGTALDYACLSNEPELLDFLISSGADYNHQDYEGSTSLMNAVLYHACKSAELLLRRGADVHITDNDGKNILHYVASVSNADMMGVFARSGVSDMETKAMDKDGKMPLQVFDERPGVSETPKLREAFLHLLDTVGKPSQHQFKHEGASSDEWTDTESEYAEFFDALETIVSP